MSYLRIHLLLRPYIQVFVEVLLPPFNHIKPIRRNGPMQRLPKPPHRTVLLAINRTREICDIRFLEQPFILFCLPQSRPPITRAGRLFLLKCESHVVVVHRGPPIFLRCVYLPPPYGPSVATQVSPAVSPRPPTACSVSPQPTTAATQRFP